MVEWESKSERIALSAEVSDSGMWEEDIGGWRIEVAVGGHKKLT